MKVFVVVARRYNGHELWTSLGVMQEAGLGFDVASTAYFIQDEVTNQGNTIKLTLGDVVPSQVSEFDGLMFVSGNMQDTEAYWHSSVTKAYVQQAEAKGMPIAAICCSVPTVRWAAKGKTVSFFPLVRSRQLLADAGALLSTLSISVDRNLATAEHQMSSQVWAEQFVLLVKGEPPTLKLVDSGYTPKGRERRPIPEVAELVRRKKGL